MFSGSYNNNDVNFLLKIIDIDETDTLLKEKMIQSGEKHYSQMLSIEKAPSKEYLEVFYQSLDNNKERFAQDILNLAFKIQNKATDDNIILVSLARAGTPVGVLLKRIISEIFNKNATHYSVSIIRDKGLDINALNYIYKNHGDSNIFFIDGWTGKGVISKELKKSVNYFNQINNSHISNLLYVVSDISGMADYCASTIDYLIPSAVLNSTISGLISRTLTGVENLLKTDFHACKFYSSLKENDLSLWFISEMMDIITYLKYNQTNDLSEIEKDYLKDKSVSFLNNLMLKYKINNVNYIKPGLGETTRVLLRRVPQRILVKNIDSNEVKHLLVLAKEKNCPIEEYKDMTYKSVGIIAQVD